MFICEKKLSVSILNKLEEFSKKNLIFIKVYSKSEVSKLLEEYKGLSVKVIDNHKIPEQEIVSWVMASLRCSESVAKLVISRTGGRMHSLVINVRALQTLPCVGRGDVLRFVKKELPYSIYDLVKWIVHDPSGLSSFSYKDAVKFVYSFQYAYAWLFETLQSEISVYLKVFQLMSVGEITTLNYKQFKELTTDKDVAGLSDSRLFGIVNCYGCISTEYLVYFLTELKTIPKNHFAIHKLLLLLKVV